MATKITAPEPPPHLRFLLALNRKMGRQMYQGTVDPVVVQKNRARNKAARASRRTNRRSR